MTKILNDPLLTAARIGTILVQIGLIIGQVALGIAVAATVAGALGFVPDNVAVSGINDLNAAILWAAAIAMALILAALGLATQFVVRLRQIIDTVGQGDPFVAENAWRLTRMAWLALIGQLLAICAGMIGGWIDSHDQHDSFDLEFNVSMTGFAIAIILFILARVFRKGTEMRAELEGTV
ncbi:MAG: DUF2975 domain-containing protein [Pseudomonadota bacterium]